MRLIGPLCRLEAKGYLRPDYYSRATGKLGRFSEELLLRRLHANGNIAGEAVVRSPADRYMLLFGLDSAITANPHVYQMSFDPMKDLFPVSSHVSNQLVLAVHPSVSARTLIRDDGQERPGLGTSMGAHVSDDFARGGRSLDMEGRPRATKSSDRRRLQPTGL